MGTFDGDDLKRYEIIARKIDEVKDSLSKQSHLLAYSFEVSLDKDTLARVALIRRELNASLHHIRHHATRRPGASAIDVKVVCTPSKVDQAVGEVAGPRKVVLPPATRIGWILSAVMTRRAFRRFVYPQIAEIQAEYFEELKAGRRGHAWWVVLRGHFLLIPGWLYGLAAKAIRQMMSP